MSPAQEAGGLGEPAPGRRCGGGGGSGCSGGSGGGAEGTGGGGTLRHKAADIQHDGGHERKYADRQGKSGLKGCSPTFFCLKH